MPSRPPVTWGNIIAAIREGRLWRLTSGSMHQAIKDADAVVDAVVDAARRYRHATRQGDLAFVQEDCGEEAPERSSESWFEEASEAEEALFAALDKLEGK